jgi:plastocyanin
MNNKILLILIVVILIIAGYFYFTQNKSVTNQMPQNQAPSTQQSQNPVNGNSVSIENFSFNPSSLTVKQGTTVTWINNDSANHTIKSDTFNSQDLNQGDKFQFMFNTKGTFDYICSIHPSMAGKIVVE